VTDQQTATTREEWLREVLQWTSRDLFGCADAPAQPDNIRVSVGFPSSGGLGKKRRVIGECWSFECSDGKFSEIFINPVLSDGVEVISTLIHEVVHATVGVLEKHRGQFVVASKAVGLQRPWTATTATPELAEKIKDFLAGFAPYPHAKLNPKNRIGPTKPQVNRQLKLACPDPQCGYVVRSTRKWIERGMPTCVCGKPFELKDPLPTDDKGEE
jgi:hypothetical protein